MLNNVDDYEIIPEDFHFSIHTNYNNNMQNKIDKPMSQNSLIKSHDNSKSPLGNIGTSGMGVQGQKEIKSGGTLKERTSKVVI